MFKDNRNWKIENEKYVKRGEIILDFAFLEKWDEELKEMNKNRWGGRYRYPDSFITFLCLIYVLYSLPYRQLEGFLKSLSKYIQGIKVPDHATIHRRVTKLNIDIKKSLTTTNEPITIAIDATGIKVARSGDWIRKIWKVRKGWLKIHFAVDTRTKEIIALEVTDERVGAIKKFKKLVNNSTKIRKVDKVLTDSEYDSNDNYKFLNSMGIKIGIKPKRKYGRYRSGNKGNKHRRKIVKAYLNNENEWKKMIGYGQRWAVEGVFSSFKRLFGEHINAKKYQNMVNEIKLKVFALNTLINFSVGR